MKKSIYLGLAALLSLAACTRSQEFDVPEGGLSLLAVTEGSAPSKTVVEDGTHVYWFTQRLRTDPHPGLVRVWSQRGESIRRSRCSAR